MTRGILLGDNFSESWNVYPTYRPIEAPRNLKNQYQEFQRTVGFRPVLNPREPRGKEEP